MSFTLRIVFAVLIIAACYSTAVFASLDDNARLGSPEMAFMNKRGFMSWQKKWARLEPSIRFFKRSGGHPLVYEDDAFF